MTHTTIWQTIEAKTYDMLTDLLTEHGTTCPICGGSGEVFPSTSNDFVTDPDPCTHCEAEGGFENQHEAEIAMRQLIKRGVASDL